MGKRILIVVESPSFDLHNRYSAVSAVISSFAHLLQDNGYEIYINDQKLSALNIGDQSPVSNVPAFYRLFPKRSREMVKDILLFRRINNLKERILQNPKPDLIISWVSYGSSFSVDLKVLWNVPLVSIFDNPLNEEYKHLFGFKPFFHKRIDFHEGRLLKNSDSIIAYSHAVKDYIVSKHKVKADFYFKAFTDFKRMTFKEYNRNDDPLCFAYIGSFFNWHKIDDLIAAFGDVRKAGYNAELILIGDGVEFDRIKELVSANPYGSAIRMTGRLDAAELEREMEKINVGIISNSLWFQAPVKLFQYSAAQLPVIYKKTPTIDELSSEEPGFFSFSSQQELIEKMTYCVTNKGQLKSFGKMAQEKAKADFSKESYLDFFNQIFKANHII